MTRLRRTFIAALAAASLLAAVPFAAAGQDDPGLPCSSTPECVEYATELAGTEQPSERACRILFGRTCSEWFAAGDEHLEYHACERVYKYIMAIPCPPPPSEPWP